MYGNAIKAQLLYMHNASFALIVHKLDAYHAFRDYEYHYYRFGNATTFNPYIYVSARTIQIVHVPF